MNTVRYGSLWTSTQTPKMELMNKEMYMTKVYKLAPSVYSPKDPLEVTL